MYLLMKFSVYNINIECQLYFYKFAVNIWILKFEPISFIIIQKQTQI